MNELVSVKHAVLDAMDDMGIDLTHELPVLTRWAIDAEKQIGSYYSLKKQRRVIKVENCRAELPCHVAFVQRVLNGDHGCDCDDLFQTCSGVLSTAQSNATTNGSFAVVDVVGDQQVRLSDTLWEIQDNKIVFQTNMNGKFVTIQYLGYEIDEHDFIKIGINHIPAIVEYIMYKWIVRSRFSPNKLDNVDKNHHWREWHRLCSHARATDSELSESDRDEILSMIHDPLIGFGLSVGMFNRQELGYGGIH